MPETKDPNSLPLYRCHKEVNAAKIAKIRGVDTGPGDQNAPGATLTFEGAAAESLAGLVVSKAYYAKHEPQAGGYFVIYKDGYQSFSPAEAFEEGYSPIEEKKKGKGRGKQSS